MIRSFHSRLLIRFHFPSLYFSTGLSSAGASLTYRAGTLESGRSGSISMVPVRLGVVTDCVRCTVVGWVRVAVACNQSSIH